MHTLIMAEEESDNKHLIIQEQLEQFSLYKQKQTLMKKPIS